MRRHVRIPPASESCSFNDTQASLAGLPRSWSDDDLHVPAERGEPACKSVNGGAFHTATKHLGKRRLICAAEPRPFLLPGLAPREGVLYSNNKPALGGTLRPP